MSMQRRAGIGILVACILLITTAVQAQSDLKPAGLAIYTDTARDIYVGALLTPDASLPTDLENVTAPIAMEYRITIRRISSRGLSGTILLQAELGSGRRAPDTVIDALGAFKQAAQGSLLKGDQLEISLNSNDETVFRLNNTELLRMNDPSIFRYLLSGWVGESSSALLRESLLAGTLDAEVSSHYDSLNPSDERTAQVVSWMADSENTEDPEAQLAATEGTENGAGEGSAEDSSGSTVGAAELATAAVTTAAATSANTAEAALESAEDAVPAPISSTNDAPVEAITQTDPTDESDTQQPAVASEEEVAETTPALAVEEATEEIESVAETELQSEEADAEPENIAALTTDESDSTAEMDDREYQWQVGTYIAKIMNKVFSEIVYPRRAVSQNIVGKVSLLIELNQYGELLDVSMEASSGHRLLDRAAERAVEAAAPFPELSMAARQEFASGDGTYQIGIPVTFKLAE